MNRLGDDTIGLQFAPDRWILYNVRTKMSLGLNGAAMLAAGSLSQEVTLIDHVTGPLIIWDVEEFYQTNGTLEDPSRICRDPQLWRGRRQVDLASLEKELVSRWLIINDPTAYESLLDRPHHPLDRNRLGNFHDQLGRHLLFDRRCDPQEWWISQKFTQDHSVRSDNCYGTVQWPHMISWFDRNIRPGMRCLDIGCGTGIFSFEMGFRGAKVLGIDPCERYLAVAKSRGCNNCDFQLAPLGTAEAFDMIPKSYFDLVFMSDALLFSFIPISRLDAANSRWILDGIRNALRPGGTFVCVEPHGDFYLAPWMGQPERPWTIVVEHRHRRFATAPVLAAMIKETLDAGFTLVELEELYRSKDLRSADSRADEFADEFPLWTMARYLRQREFMNSRYIYTTEQLVEALQKVGVNYRSILMVHVSLGRIGINKAGHDEATACGELLKALKMAVGGKGTILVPTYTYSLGHDEIFDAVNTPSRIGIFSEFVRTTSGFIRSREPMLAVSGCGPAAETLLGKLPPTCYGRGSVYDRLANVDAIIATIGLDLNWATFLHHSEELANVPYRRIKNFDGRILESDGSVVSETWSYFAAPFIECCRPDVTQLAKSLREEGVARSATVGIGEIVAINAQNLP